MKIEEENDAITELLLDLSSKMSRQAHEGLEMAKTPRVDSAQSFRSREVSDDSGFSIWNTPPTTDGSAQTSVNSYKKGEKRRRLESDEEKEALHIRDSKAKIRKSEVRAAHLPDDRPLGVFMRHSYGEVAPSPLAAGSHQIKEESPMNVTAETEPGYSSEHEGQEQKTPLTSSTSITLSNSISSLSSAQTSFASAVSSAEPQQVTTTIARTLIEEVLPVESSSDTHPPLPLNIIPVLALYQLNNYPEKEVHLSAAWDSFLTTAFDFMRTVIMPSTYDIQLDPAGPADSESALAVIEKDMRERVEDIEWEGIEGFVGELRMKMRGIQRLGVWRVARRKDWSF